MLLYEEINAGVVTIRLSGYLVASNPASVGRLDSFCPGDLVPRVIVDLGKVRFIDSFGMSTIFKFAARCRAQGGDVKLARLQRHILRPFTMLRLDKKIELFPSHKKALQSFSTSSRNQGLTQK